MVVSASQRHFQSSFSPEAFAVVALKGSLGREISFETGDTEAGSSTVTIILESGSASI